MISDFNEELNKKKITDLKEKLREDLGDIKYKTWIEYALDNCKIEDNKLYLEFENYFHKMIFEERYLEVVKENIDFEVQI